MVEAQLGGGWNGRDLPGLLSLENLGSFRYRSRFGDGNLNGRSYGGQILGQALMAAAMTAPENRPASSFQLTFLRGADPQKPIDFIVAVLQDGRRFSSRHVLGFQGNDAVLSANATFASLLTGPHHSSPSNALEDPRSLPELKIIPDAIMRGLSALGSYSQHTKETIDYRIPDIERQLGTATACARLRFWLRSRQRGPKSFGYQAASFAYLSDWWLNFSSLGPHLRDHGSAAPLYISSLNHCIWFYQPFSPSDWMHFETESPGAQHGRGLSFARIHDERGALLASASQESLMVQSSRP